jgi:hypothetical protein
LSPLKTLDVFSEHYYFPKNIKTAADKPPWDPSQRVSILPIFKSTDNFWKCVDVDSYTWLPKFLQRGLVFITNSVFNVKNMGSIDCV